MLCLFLITLFSVLQKSIFVSGRKQDDCFDLKEIFSGYSLLRNVDTMVHRIRREGLSNEVSCRESSIKKNLTLRGGLEAGYFRKLAQHVAMRLCVELCCVEKGCDVAFMWGKNCYGVQCFTHELCDVIPPAKPVSPGALLMISHVTFHGQKASKQKKQPEQCISTQVQPGVTLRGGLKAGNFTHIGTVMNLKTCINLCCTTNGCDIALVVNDECFAVSCYTTDLCEMTKAFTKTYKPQLAYVQKPGLGQKQNLSIPKIGTEDPTENQVICKNSQVFVNTTLKGGYRAGNYTNFGKVQDMTECIRLCCGNRDCDAALMLENNCFSVACKDVDNCLPVHAKSTQLLASLNPTVSYITSRSEEVLFEKQQTSDGVCHAGIVSYDVSLRGGSAAGNFTPHGKVKNVQSCISKCCQIKGCDVVMMLQKVCYTVMCKNDRSCEKRQTPTGSKFNPRIVYVFKDKKTEQQDFSSAVAKETHNTPNPQPRLQFTSKFSYQPTTTTTTTHPLKLHSYNQNQAVSLQKSLTVSHNRTETIGSLIKPMHAHSRPVTRRKDIELNRDTVTTAHNIGTIYNFDNQIPNRGSFGKLNKDTGTIANEVDSGTVTKDDSTGINKDTVVEHNRFEFNRSTSVKVDDTEAYKDAVFKVNSASLDKDSITQMHNEESFLVNFLRNNTNYRLPGTMVHNHSKKTKTSTHPESLPKYNGSFDYKHTLRENRTLQNDAIASLQPIENQSDEAHTFDTRLNTTQIDTNKLEDFVSTEAEDETIEEEISTTLEYSKTHMKSDLDFPPSYINMSNENDITNEENLTQPCEDSEVLEKLDRENCSDSNIGSEISDENLNNQEKIFYDRSNVTYADGNETSTKKETFRNHMNEDIEKKEKQSNGKGNVSNKTNEAKTGLSMAILSRLIANHKMVDTSDPTCTYSDVLRNFTLRGNLRSGKFTDRGQMENIKQCARLCCMLKGCDLAFMLFKTCFTVNCNSAQLCEPVQAKSTVDSPILCYIIVKTAA